ncbi:hypothetical protein Celaphus_00010280 [Cervus elaphus hippelaphus]|uniref:Uncharacterized protein n=1 Tax=Cervus elaphus hippelaphus TaxID=46360 RepID=A0A212CA51_CEREH|nr:hypothetical protein Celaphus_00010280 [Cervus elaphus hippelaphus]
MPPGTDRVPFVCLPAVLTDRPLLTHNVLSELTTLGTTPHPQCLTQLYFQHLRQWTVTKLCSLKTSSPGSEPDQARLWQRYSGTLDRSESTVRNTDHGARFSDHRANNGIEGQRRPMAALNSANATMAAVKTLNPKAEVARAQAALAVNISAARGLQDMLRTNLEPKGP